ncbi:MAG: hypothetical protein Q8R02_14655 [Hyphomonadaceae bacterium]|nr:hypothetical protein [Hyphomonadaceae bacterium]
MRIKLAVAAVVMLAACGSVKQQATTNRAANVESVVSVGDVMLRVDVKESLPNAFGKADIFGRKRNKGFSEIRYMGLGADGKAIFRRRDVDVVTNETTMNSTGVRTGVVTVQPSGSGAIATGVTTGTAAPSVEVVAPDTIQFALDLQQEKIITVHEQTIEVLAATGASVRFILR